VHVSLTPQTRFFSILVPAIVAGGVSVAMMVNGINGQADQFTWVILFFSLWVVFDHVVALAHPDSIAIDDDQVAFSSFGRTHTYAWSSVERFRIKRLASGSFYVRINDGGLLKGRYWIPLHKFPERERLMKTLIDHQR
jgi:hypothetical protein